MASVHQRNPAFGHAIEPHWTRSDKDGVGTAYSQSSPLWFTVAKGVVTEVYFPTIDAPQIRDLQYLATDGATFFHDERRGFDNKHDAIDNNALGFRITNTSHAIPSGQTYQIIKQVISAPSSPCLLIHTRIVVDEPLRSALRLYALIAPHMDGTGWNNRAWIADSIYGKVLVARGARSWLALGATIPFLKSSCGIVGATDGWQDLNGNEIPGNRRFVLDWEFDSALDSNVALTGELDLSRGTDFVLGVAFGSTLNNALVTLRGALILPFDTPPGGGYGHLQAFLDQWKDAQRILRPSADALQNTTGDGGHLYRISRSILMAHEDKTYDGALIASLSIPWGETSNDANKGYHLVWTRDMCNSASALLASGEVDIPLRALVFLATVQITDETDPYRDGGFYQNFHVDGTPAQTNIQLDEIAFPVMLAWRLDQEKALQGFDPYPMVLAATKSLLLNGPMTQQEALGGERGLFTVHAGVKYRRTRLRHGAGGEAG